MVVVRPKVQTNNIWDESPVNKLILIHKQRRMLRQQTTIRACGEQTQATTTDTKSVQCRNEEPPNQQRKQRQTD